MNNREKMAVNHSVISSEESEAKAKKGKESKGSHGAARPESPNGTLSTPSLRRWRGDYRKVFPGEKPEGEVFEARLRAAFELIREKGGLSRLEALKLVKERESSADRAATPPEPPPSQEEVHEGENTGGKPPLDRWTRAYIEVFGGEPQGEEGARRLEAAKLLYDPERGIGRGKALTLVKEVEDRLKRVVPTEKGLEVTEVSLGAALLRLGRLEGRLEALERLVERTHDLANAANSRALNLHSLVRTAERTAEQEGERTPEQVTRQAGRTPERTAGRTSEQTPEQVTRQAGRTPERTAGRTSEQTPEQATRRATEQTAERRVERTPERLSDNPPPREGVRKEDLERVLSELKGGILQEMEGRLAALESWVRRIGKYLGASQGEHLQEKATKEKSKRWWPF